MNRRARDPQTPRARTGRPAAALALVLACGGAACGDAAPPEQDGVPDSAAPPSAVSPPQYGPESAPEPEPDDPGRIPGAVPLADGRVTGFDTVFAYFTAQGETRVAVSRAVPDTTDALRAAFDALLRGPRDSERNQGVQSWFSHQTAGMVNDVSVVDGFAVVDLADLRPVIPNAVGSAGALMLLGELSATAFQFPGIRRVEFRINGDCEALMSWLQFGCYPIVRSEWEEPEGFRGAVPADPWR